MVNESGSISSLYAATPREIALSKSGGAPPVQSGGRGTYQATAGQLDRPGFLSLYARIRAAGESSGESAVQLRKAQSSLGQADDLLSEIKARLLQIVKQYPPFAQDSPQRIAYLNAIIGLRKQLDALAFPAERQGQESAPLGVELRQASPKPDSPVRGDLALPELDPRNASDAEIETALDAVEILQGKVQASSKSLWQAVVSYVGEANMGHIADYKAQSQAAYVRGLIADNSPSGIGVSAHTILAYGG